MRASITAIAVVLLAACSSGGGGGNVQQAEENGSALNGSAATSGAGPAAGTATATLQPGQWELKTEVLRMNVPNMPAGVSPPMPPPSTVTYCLTAEQARQPNANFFTGSGEGGGCRSDNMSMTGGRIQGTVQCEGQGVAMRSELSGEFAATSYRIEQRVHTSAQGMDMDMESRTSGRRLGDCPG
jgi:hypothetical protein